MLDIQEGSEEGRVGGTAAGDTVMWSPAFRSNALPDQD